jgi:uncharacterized protein YgbK (DUF1537 family)
MIRLLIIADDFTGALDTGVQMAGYGAVTKVTTDTGLRFADYADTEVLVIDAETRHLKANDAGTLIRGIVERAVKFGIPQLYKKTDSALRGNIGAELEAILDASGETVLPFLPALPQIGRTTVGGVHYIKGVPVAESVFGIDPFEPVRHSRVADIIAEQSAVPVHEAAAGESGLAFDAGICVYDAETQEQLLRSGEKLMEAGALHIAAGSAGFGSVLPDLLGLRRGDVTPPKLDPRLLVICGSVNPITLEQTAEADRAGFAHWRLSPRQKLEPGYWKSEEGAQTLSQLRQLLAESPYLIIDSNDEGGNGPTERYAAERGLGTEDVRVGISRGLGEILGGLFLSPDLGTLLITGGDTLLQCMGQLGVTELEPICELYPGVVLSRFSWQGRSRMVLSKSGGFGQRTLFADLKNSLQK